MKRAAAVEISPCDPPVLGDLSLEPFSPHDWSKAMDVVAWLTEQAGRLAPRGAGEAAMSKAFSAAFGHMVAYFHHVTLDGDLPCEALAKAAAGTMELTPEQRDFVRAASSTRGLNKV